MKTHKDLDTIDLEAPRFAQYMQKAWKRHQNTVYWVDRDHCSEERIEVLSNTIERDHFFTKHSQPVFLCFESCCGF